jgi:ribosomal protein S15P/S13E
VQKIPQDKSKHLFEMYKDHKSEIGIQYIYPEIKNLGNSYLRTKCEKTFFAHERII